MSVIIYDRSPFDLFESQPFTASETFQKQKNSLAYFSSISYYLAFMVVLMKDMMGNSAATGPTVQDWVTVERAIGL